jgi:hypothetical protein
MILVNPQERMELMTNVIEKLKIENGGKERKLNLRTSGDELEWEFLYTTELGERRSYGSYYNDLHCKFRLKPLRGMNFLKTSSYSLDLSVENGEVKTPLLNLAMNEVIKCYTRQQSDGKPLGGEMTLIIQIMLEGGEVTSVSNTNRFFKSKELSDVEIRCGDLAIPAHRNVLTAQSETFR